MKNSKSIFIILFSLLLSACGGGGESSSESSSQSEYKEKQERVALSANDLFLSFSEQGIAYPQVSNFYGNPSYRIADGAAEDVVWIDPNTGEMTLLAAGATQITVEDLSNYYQMSSVTFTVTVEQADNNYLSVSPLTIPTVNSDKVYLSVHGQKGKLEYHFEPEGMVNFDEGTGLIEATGAAGEVAVTVTDSGDRNYRSSNASSTITIEAVHPDTLIYSPLERSYENGLTLSPLKVNGIDGGTYHYELDKEYENSPVLSLDPDSGIMTVHQKGDVWIKVTQQLGAEYGDAVQVGYFEVSILPGVRDELEVANAELLYKPDFIYTPAVNNNIAPVRYEILSGEDVVQVDEQTGLIRVVGVGYADLKVVDDHNTNYPAAEKSFSLTVEPAVHPGITAQTLTLTYSDGLSIEPKLEGQIGALTFTGSSEAVSIAGDKLDIIKAGTADLSVTDDGGVNYQTSPPVSLTVNILKAAHPGFTAENITTTFIPDHCVVAQVSGEIGELRVTPVSSSDDHVAQYNAEKHCFMIKRSGTAQFNLVREESDNYLASEPKQISVIVNPADSHLTVDGDLARTFVAGKPTVSPPAIGGGTGHLSFELVAEESEPNVIDVDPATGEITILNAGNAVVSVHDAGDGNYGAASIHFAVTIEKAVNPVTVSYRDAVYDPNGTIEPVIENVIGDIRFSVSNPDTSPVTISGSGVLAIRSAGSFNVEVVALESRNYLSRAFSVGGFIEKAIHPEVEPTRVTLEYAPLKKTVLELPKAVGIRTYSVRMASGWDNKYISVNPNSGEVAMLDFDQSVFSSVFVSEAESELYQPLSPVAASMVTIAPPKIGAATRDVTLSPVFTSLESTVDYTEHQYHNTYVNFAGAQVLQPTDEELQTYGEGVALSLEVQSVEDISNYGRKVNGSVRVYVQRYEGCPSSVNILNLPNLMKEKKAVSFEKGSYCLFGPASRWLTYTVVDKSDLERFYFYQGDWETIQPFVTYRTSDDYPVNGIEYPMQLLEWDRIELTLATH